MQKKLDETIEKLSRAEAQINILENSISKPEFDLKPSLVIQKLPWSETKSDMDLVIDVFKEINTFKDTINRFHVDSTIAQFV